MSEPRKPKTDPEAQRESGEPGGGQGRRDEVGGSGVYPASAGSAPADAVIRAPGEWGAGAGGEEGGQSELRFTEEELRQAEKERSESEPDEQG
jgi:hypothetical protein